MPLTPDDFGQSLVDYKRDLLRRGKRGGPGYVADDECKPLVWHDQVFGRELTPVGTVPCPNPLRVGSTLNGVDVILVASNANTGPLTIAAGSTITFSFSQADTPDGVFEDVGPTVCVKAPTGGMSIDPDCLVLKCSPGNFKKPWLKVSLEFDGAIAGGTVDCALAYQPR